MIKILVLGMGLMGPTVARDCAGEPEVSKVLGCDIDDAKLEAAKKYVDDLKFGTLKVDVTDHNALVKAFRGFDVVVNCTAAKLSLSILDATMEAKVDLLDLAGGGYPHEGDVYDRVNDAGITAVPGCGVDPGLVDMLVGHAMEMMDSAEEVYFACGGIPRDPEPPLDYKIVFGGTRIPIRPGKVPMIENGKQVMVDRYDDVESIFVERLRDMEAFYDGFPSSLLKLCLEKGVRTFKAKTVRYEGYVDKLMFLRDLGVIGERPVTFKDVEIVPMDFFQDLIYPLVKFDESKGDRDVTVLLVRVGGKKDGSDVQVSYDMVDFYDEERKVTSMAKTTGYTAAIVARILARGDIPQKGIQWPVRVVKGKLFDELLRGLRARGVVITETVTTTR